MNMAVSPFLQRSFEDLGNPWFCDVSQGRLDGSAHHQRGLVGDDIYSNHVFNVFDSLR